LCIRRDFKRHEWWQLTPHMDRQRLHWMVGGWWGGGDLFRTPGGGCESMSRDTCGSMAYERVLGEVYHWALTLVTAGMLHTNATLFIHR